MLRLYKFLFYKFKKSFSCGFALSSGRNFLGRICVQHQGGGNKHNYVQVDRFRFINQFGFIIRIIRGLFCTGFFGLILYNNGLVTFILLSEGITRESRVFSGSLRIFTSFQKLGSTQRLLHINLFESINSIELFPRSGAVVARAAGTSSKIITKDNRQSVLKLSSGWLVKLSNHSLACFGIVSNIAHGSKSIDKAGNNRQKGIRPTVRGVIKNPCDHPHGGGEGKGSPPVAQVSPWGWLCKGTPTKNKKVDKIRRRLYKKI